MDDMGNFINHINATSGISASGLYCGLNYQVQTDNRRVIISEETMKNFKIKLVKETHAIPKTGGKMVDVDYFWAFAYNIETPFYSFLVQYDDGTFRRLSVKYVDSVILLHKEKNAINMRMSHMKFQNCLFKYKDVFVQP